MHRVRVHGDILNGMSFASIFADGPARATFAFLTLRDIAGAVACSRELHRQGLDSAQRRLQKVIDETLTRLRKVHANCRLDKSDDSFRDARISISLVSEGLSAVDCNIVELLRAPRRVSKFLEWLGRAAARTPYECGIGCTVSTVFLGNLERIHWSRHHPFGVFGPFADVKISAPSDVRICAPSERAMPRRGSRAVRKSAR